MTKKKGGRGGGGQKRVADDDQSSYSNIEAQKVVKRDVPPELPPKDDAMLRKRFNKPTYEMGPTRMPPFMKELLTFEGCPVFDKNARPDEPEKPVPLYQKIFDYTVLFVLGILMIMGFAIAIYGTVINLLGKKLY
eukprot:TRINITY_DN38921_c0_g1_i1.p1 TRINITY_DN38921_c0_g1~~TRINITY_DN38921_c0_g1_i1.p1  ORF type:complete len:135 (-),score=44.54 TRINITY_DN38921_c0_g1_i1:117-521(-)